jgi:Fe-Mn family superoxide dismutase
MDCLSRREVLGAAVIGGWSVLAGDVASAQQGPASAPAGGSGPYVLPPLPFGYADLEPHIDAETMKLHHDLHHEAYVRGANAALAELERLRSSGGMSSPALRAATDSLSFNLCGHALHTIFWSNLRPGGGGDPPNDSVIASLLKRDFGSVEKWREHFSWTAEQVQGGGWAVLAYEPIAARLIVLGAEKHQNGGAWAAVPLLVADVWEHAYYLLYRNKRAGYLKALMEVIHWESVDARLQAAQRAADTLTARA